MNGDILGCMRDVCILFIIIHLWSLQWGSLMSRSPRGCRSGRRKGGGGVGGGGARWPGNDAAPDRILISPLERTRASRDRPAGTSPSLRRRGRSQQEYAFNLRRQKNRFLLILTDDTIEFRIALNINKKISTTLSKASSYSRHWYGVS